MADVVGWVKLTSLPKRLRRKSSHQPQYQSLGSADVTPWEMLAGNLLVGPEFDLMQGRNDLFTNQLDGPHHVFMRHVALVSVTV